MPDSLTEKMAREPALSCRIAVPVYKELTPPEVAVLKHNMAQLGTYDVVLFGPVALRQYLTELKDLCAAFGNSGAIDTACFADVHFASIQAYSGLMLSQSFYDLFSGDDFVLICQLDCLIIDGDLQPWLERGYSFVGAPVFEGFGQPKRPYAFTGELNGGLSLRKISHIDSVLKQAIFAKRGLGMRILEKTALLQLLNLLLVMFGKKLVPIRPGLNEDIVWTGIVPSKFEAFSIPEPKVAVRFAFETAPRYLFELTDGELPFGCHAFEKYDQLFWEEHGVIPDGVPAIDDRNQ